MSTTAVPPGLAPLALAAMIDHTLLKAFGTPEDIERLCDEALRYGFATVTVNPAQVVTCARLLADSGVGVGAVVGFPLGQNTSAVKAFEMRDAIDKGASDIDMVINVRALQSGDAALVRREIADLAAVCRAANVTNKVILETCYLTDAEKQSVCRMAAEEGADFVKTSTGFGPAGATAADVRLLRETVGPGMGVKASGGIRDLGTALAMIDAGATRLGASAGVAIMEEMKSKSIPERRMELGWPGDKGVGDMLVRQIIQGQKTATCGFKVDYTPEELSEVTSGAGELYAASAYGQEPRCVIRVTEVFETPFGDPDARLVRGEGDGDDVAKFQDDHRVAWAASHADSPLRDSEPLIVELFELVRIL